MEGRGTPASMDCSTVQRPSPESSTYGESPERAGSFSNARSASSRSQDRTTLPLFHREAIARRSSEKGADDKSSNPSAYDCIMPGSLTAVGALPPITRPAARAAARSAPPDHEAVPLGKPPDPAAGPGVEKPDPALGKTLRPSGRFLVERVPAVHNHVPGLEGPGEKFHVLVHGRTGRNHEPHHPRGGKDRNRIGDRRSREGPLAGGLPDRICGAVGGDHFVPSAEQPAGHVETHLPQSHHRDPHQSTSGNSASGGFLFRPPSPRQASSRSPQGARGR